MKTITNDKTVATLANYLRAQDPERAEKTEKLKATLENTLNALRSAKVDTVAQRKAMAMQKLARVKASLQALKMSVVTDPRIMARLAARLAKELAAAVKEYMAAGGTSSEIGSTPSPSPSGETSETQPTSAENSDAVTVTVSADPKPAPAPQPTVKEPETEPDYHSGDIWPKRIQTDHAASAYQTAQNRNSNDGEDSSGIINSAKDDLNLLRRMLKQARSYHSLLSRENKDAPSEKMVRDALDDAEKVIDKAFDSLNANA